jgi:streptogramin lyase
MRAGATILIIASALFVHAVSAAAAHDIHELDVKALLKLGKTADWVAIDRDAVWVGTTGPNAIHRIDPKENRNTASVKLPGTPCAGLALGFGYLWAPLCSKPASLARIELATQKLTVFPVGPAAEEGGVAVAAGSVWLVTDKQGALSAVDPASGAIKGVVKVPAGSYNPIAVGEELFVTQADGKSLTRIDARSQKVRSSLQVGANPRFLTSGSSAVWTLNQGDGSLSRVDLATESLKQLQLHTPGHGGDIGHYAGLIFTTMPKTPLSLIDARDATLKCQWTGPGGDSLGLGFGSLWLTDYTGGTVSRIEVRDILDKCDPSLAQQHPIPDA